MPTDFKPPAAVSPLIKAFRWGLLVAGIFYGMNKKIIFTELEKSRKRKEIENRIARDKEMLANEKQVNLPESVTSPLEVDPAESKESNNKQIPSRKEPEQETNVREEISTELDIPEKDVTEDDLESGTKISHSDAQLEAHKHAILLFDKIKSAGESDNFQSSESYKAFKPSKNPNDPLIIETFEAPDLNIPPEGENMNETDQILDDEVPDLQEPFYDEAKMKFTPEDILNIIF